MLWSFAVSTAQAKPRPALPPLPETYLALWRFDTTNEWASPRTAPLAWLNLASAESWSGYALQMDGGLPRLLALPAVAGNGKTNLGLASGTIRFWFSPSWTSRALGGGGPGASARLLEVGAWTETQGAGGWSLACDESGDALAFAARIPTGDAVLMTVPLQWRAGQWHQVALSYSPAGSWLFLDGQLAAQGLPTAFGIMATNGGRFGFCLGSDVNGNHLAQGLFDELTTFSSPLSAVALARNFSSVSALAVLGPVTEAEETARFQRAASAGAARSLNRASSQTSLASEPPLPGEGGESGTNAPPELAPPYDGPELHLEVPAWTANGLALAYGGGDSSHPPYDVFLTTNLNSILSVHDGCSPLPWAWVYRTSSDQTNWVLSPLPPKQAFVRLALTTDTDSDGLTDAFEVLVSKSNPSTPYTRGDGVDDWTAYALGLGPWGGVLRADTNNLLQLELFTPIQ